MKLASRRFNLFLIIFGALVFHSVCRIWISWYLLAMAVLVPLFSAAVSFLPMKRARAAIDMNETLMHREREYIRCCCRGRGRILGYPPRCVMRIKVSYLAADHSSEYEAVLSAGQPMYIRVNTIHCSAVKVECYKSYTLDYLGVFRMKLKAPPTLLGVIVPEPVLDEDRIEKTAGEVSELPDISSPKRSRELYELRDYREGDILRDIHWKMTAKTGRVIVRETERVEDERIAVTFDLMEDLADNDRLMEYVLGVSRDLIDNGRPHSLIWYDENENLRSAAVGDRGTQRAAFMTMLGDRPPATGATTADAELGDYHVIMHITLGEAEEQ